MKRLLIYLLIINSHLMFGQTISGYIYDLQTKVALPGATVYLDGTTIGTTSDFEGYFKIDISSSNTVNLIVSFLGYETKVILPAQFEDSMTINLNESTNQLNEVELGFDTWSREKKMGIFKREFLGKEQSSTQCKIMNKRAIILIHNSSKNTLIAYANEPIIIKNNYLGYEINYNLADFEIEFIDNPQGLFMPNMVYYAGTSFYKDLKNKTKKQQLENRENEYHGSLIHFMRSLSTGKLTENDFGIYHEKFPVEPYDYFKLSDSNGLTKISLTTSKLTLLYKKYDQSSVELLEKDENTFYVDETGNHSPPNILVFSGVLGTKRISSTLPLNFKLNIESGSGID